MNVRAITHVRAAGVEYRPGETFDLVGEVTAGEVEPADPPVKAKAKADAKDGA